MDRMCRGSKSIPRPARTVDSNGASSSSSPWYQEPSVFWTLALTCRKVNSWDPMSPTLTTINKTTRLPRRQFSRPSFVGKPSPGFFFCHSSASTSATPLMSASFATSGVDLHHFIHSSNSFRLLSKSSELLMVMAQAPATTPTCGRFLRQASSSHGAWRLGASSRRASQLWNTKSSSIEVDPSRTAVNGNSERLSSGRQR